MPACLILSSFLFFFYLSSSSFLPAFFFFSFTEVFPFSSSHSSFAFAFFISSRFACLSVPTMKLLSYNITDQKRRQDTGCCCCCCYIFEKHNHAHFPFHVPPEPCLFCLALSILLFRRHHLFDGIRELLVLLLPCLFSCFFPHTCHAAMLLDELLVFVIIEIF